MTFAYRRAAGALIGSGALVVSPLVALPASAAPVDIQLVGINDFHGRLEASVDRDTGDVIGGAEQISGLLNELRAANPNTLFVSAGDNIGASTFTSNVQGDEPTIQALDAMGLAVSAVGNHEFDQGFADIAVGGRVDLLAEFPYLGANVYAAGTTNPVLDEYVVQDVGGVSVGFVGVVTGETETLVSPAGIQDIDFGDPTEAANRVAGRLSDGDATNGEADVVVLLGHTGSTTGDCAAMTSQTGEFGLLLNGLTTDTDMIFSGHTHDDYACENVTGAAGFSGPVVQSGQYGQNLDVIEFTVDPAVADADITLTRAAVLPVVNIQTAPTPAVTQIVQDAVAFAQQEGAVELGVVTQDITRAFDETGGEDRGSESVLGNFIADVQLAQSQEAGAQIALMNPGGLRDDFLVDGQFAAEPPGVVTLGEANAVQPFANTVVTMTLTGAQIESVLEEQWQPERASRDFLALGVSEGFFFTYDPDAPRSERITSVTLDGVPLDPAAEYRVTVNSFLATGGDNFATLAAGTDRQELGITDLEALTAYFAANSPITPDTESRRAVAVATTPQARPVDDSCTAAITEDGFVDVPSSNPFEAVVDCLRYWGLTKGTSATTYSPGSPVTREQMAAFIARLVVTSGGTLPSGGDAFEDDEGSNFEGEINQLAAAGIVNGTGVGTYSPKLLVTRAQMAKFLVLAYEYRAAEEGLEPITPDADYFPDDESSWAQEWINAAATAGFTGGHVDGTYRPEEAVRRDHMAAFLTRVLDLMVENAITEVPASAV